MLLGPEHGHRPGEAARDHGTRGETGRYGHHRHRAPDPQPVRLTATRGRVLETLQNADRPLGAAAVADRVGLPPNTARVHLDALVGATLGSAAREDTDHPGRPRVPYTDQPNTASVDRRGYRLLAEIVTGSLARTNPHPGGAALVAGHTWGGTWCRDRRRSSGSLSSEHSANSCAPWTSSASSPSWTADRLEPFATPGACVAELVAHAGERGPSDPPAGQARLPVGEAAPGGSVPNGAGAR